MAKIVIDGVSYEVDPANNLLQECLSQGLDLPYFCWHPCMGSVGACRQCAVKQYRDADDKDGILVMACMTPASDGTIISIEDTQAKSFRADVIESLMISHPHDCPVCEEGGECHLQDMTQMSGHNYRRYDKKKVTHRNQYLGPFINHEMNRCIACYRCVRYYNDYAGGTDLSAQASHHHVYFGRQADGVLESEFSGNLVEVCPTGVFTDKGFSENYTRKWDLQSAPSVCVGCAVGCNTTPGERYGSLRRLVNRYNSEINGYFLCDRGRFGFDFVNSEQRLTEPVRIVNGESQTLAAAELSQTLTEFSSGGAIGIGSPRASNESNFMLRCLVGEKNFYAGCADTEHEALQTIIEFAADPSFHCPSISEIEQADAVVILGEDVTNTAPRLALALRQSVRNKALSLAEDSHIASWQDAAVRELAQQQRSPLCVLSSYATRLDDVASDTIIEAPGVLTAIGFGIANKLSDKAPAADARSVGAYAEVIEAVAEQLMAAKRPLIIAGTSAGKTDLIHAAANIARALKEKHGSEKVDLCLLVPEVNSMGLTMMVNKENTLGRALKKLSSGAVSHAVVLENDLYRRADSGVVDAALERLENLMVLDLLETATTAKASVVLPTTAFSEHEATYVNYEGRAQLSFQVHMNHGAAKPAWRWLNGEQECDVETMVNRCSSEARGFDKLGQLLPDPAQFVAGMKIPRQSQRYSGRTAIKANLDVHEPKQPVDSESVMAFSMEGIPAQKDAAFMASAWAPRWNSNQSISKFQEEVNGKLKQGHIGTQLIEKLANGGAYLPPASPSTEVVDGSLEVVLAHQIFGSDELSARSDSIQQRMTDPYIGISPTDAQAQGVQHGDMVSLDGIEVPVVACIRSKMPEGVVAIYCGDGDINPHSLPATVSIGSSESPVGERGIRGLIVSDLLEDY
ncbi:MAG: NADH-quinone oxidoreductase subunit G [Gammaproteobacteria bacterium]|nr:NADH-quinone oxidoreductase subunit G [Gammaproteobacteria bacterium]